jgi:uncharacterized protein (TIGR02147 family)
MLSIYSYKEPINFINSFIDQKRLDYLNFTINKLSNDLGLSSPIQIVDILKGKKEIKDKFFDAFSDYAKLTKSERMYFQALVSKSKESNDERLCMFELLIEELRPSNKNKPVPINYEDDLDIFTDWIYTAILSLSELKEFELTVENIKSSLVAKIETERIENALFQLFQYGLLRLNDEGKVEKRFLRTTTKRGLKLKDIESYYSMICDLAKESLEIESSRIEFNMFSFPIDEKNIPLAKEIICKCRNQLSRLSEDGDPNKVYQANLSLFPLTN